MPLAHRAARRRPMPLGLIILADQQSSGRGRFQRRWEASAGSALLMSALLGSELVPEKIEQLPMLAAVAVVHALSASASELENQVKIKWPNDLLLTERNTNPLVFGKVGGILIEAAFENTNLHYAVVGIGINLHQKKDELQTIAPGSCPPMSLQEHLGYGIDRIHLLTQICRHMNALAADARCGADIFPLWRKHLLTLGQPVTVSRAIAPTFALDSELSLPFSGKAVDVTREGSLIIEDAQGKRRTFASGDVTLREISHAKDVV